MKCKLLISVVMVFASLPLFAGGIFYNSNQSAEYFRTYERNAATDNADIVYYNMSGTTKMKDGFYINGSNQTLLQKATVKTKNNPVIGDKTYTSDNPIWFVPNLYLLYKKDTWSVFSGFEAIGATAIREWKDGLPTLDLEGKLLSPTSNVSSYTKGNSEYLAFRLGGAYSFNELVSVALCGRAVYSEQNVNGYIDIPSVARSDFDYTDKATGYSGEFNIDFFPMKGMTASFTYEMATRLKFKRSINDSKSGGGLFTDGEKYRLDLPQALRFGLSYKFTEELRVEVGVNAYLEKYADFSGLDYNDSFVHIDSKKAYNNTWEEGICVEYTFSKYFLVSAGFNMNQIGQKKSATFDITSAGGQAQYMSIGVGGQVSPVDDLKINLALAYTGFVKSYSYSDGYDKYVGSLTASSPSKEYFKRYINIGIGAEYRML